MKPLSGDARWVADQDIQCCLPTLEPRSVQSVSSLQTPDFASIWRIGSARRHSSTICDLYGTRWTFTTASSHGTHIVSTVTKETSNQDCRRHFANAICDTTTCNHAWLSKKFCICYQSDKQCYKEVPQGDAQSLDGLVFDQNMQGKGISLVPSVQWTLRSDMLPTGGSSPTRWSVGSNRYQQKAHWSNQGRSASERYSISNGKECDRTNEVEARVTNAMQMRKSTRRFAANIYILLSQIICAIFGNLKLLSTSPHGQHLCV